ncbi:hypothetical protein I5L50_26390 [Serratia marcescens]|nr:hypothetical protein [Serratia marcescens]
MDNKLSELSKPVAWTSARSLDVRRKITAFTDAGSAAEYASANCWEKIVPLYSQEYVSALLAELEAKDKRIAELEAVKADASEVFKEIGNELGCNPDNESIMMAIDDLKKDNTSLRDQRAGLVQAASELGAKLATPVRLSCETHPRCRTQHAKDVRAAGFTVEGDKCQYRLNSDPPCQSKTDPPPLNYSIVAALVFFWS